MITHATKFEEINKGVVLVDFYATWCGPCKMMAPALEAFAAVSPGLNVVKVDVDEAPVLAAQFGIRSVPTIALLKDGKVLKQRSGAMSVAQLADFVKL